MTAYINYFDLSEFYTIQETCNLLNMDKTALKQKCGQYGVSPRRNEIGEWGFVKYDVRKLHNHLYYEDRPAQKDDSWA